MSSTPPQLNSTRLVRGLLAVALGMAAAAAISVAAAQTFSPGISPSKIDVNEQIGQGERVSLPELGIQNRGNAPALFSVDVTHSNGQPELFPDQSWFSFSPREFTLQPGEGQLVSVLLKVPRDAVVGDYKVLLRAKAGAVPQAGGGGSGVTVNAAVAATLTYSVKHVNFNFYDPIVSFFTDRAPFSYIGVGILALVIAVYLFQLRYGLDINLRRRE